MADAWRGKPPPVRDVQVISRIGGDLAPVDPVSQEGRLLLLAYVWADQTERLERLRGACELAARIPAELRRESAAETIAGLSLQQGAWTVLWHSIFQQYLDAEQISEMAGGIARLGATATESARFAHVTLELAKPGPATPVELTTWPGSERRVIGTALPHGVPVTWTA